MSDAGSTKISDLEFNDPLYLHPSDTSGASLITHKLKGTENYNVWSCAIKLTLQTKNKLEFIDGSCPRFQYEDDDVLLSQWDRCNSVVLSWILVSLTEEVYNGQIFSKTAEVVWTELKETYDKVDASVTFVVKMSDEMVKIDDIVKASKSYQDHNQFLKLMQFLMGLDSVYTTVRSQILTTDPVPNVKTAFSIISRDESHRLHTSNGNNIKGQTSAFAGKVGNAGNTNNSFNKKKYRNPPLKCTNCNMLSHTVDRCYEIIGYPPGYIKKLFNQGDKQAGEDRRLKGEDHQV
ncbi:uncharacterized protein [Rutidosis leptorrhynchoides]|uniref:uncharacterized protein n=1 Tax=Rutidosis leptorrhynchoides TaxID=125765 RepID=UPI003A991D6D